MSNLSRAGIARGNINLIDFRALGQLPDQCMLPGTAANNKYPQSLPPTIKILRQ